MNLLIERSKIAPNANGGYERLSHLNKISDISDIREIRWIWCEFLTEAERDEFSGNIPKSYGGRKKTIFAYGKPEKYAVAFEFNTLWTTKVTGPLNESAIARREKVINKLISLGVD